MRILLDHNVPAPLRYWLIGHQVDTAYELGWAEVSNGELLRSAESAGFDVMITTDQSIRYQQNLAGRKLAIVAIDTNDWTQIRNSKSAVLDALAGIAPGAYIEVEIPLR
jgi:predicted nuclease of predicted toxin-antitoxin system